MIYRIQKKQYDEIKRRRKHAYQKVKGEAILFKAVNGLYYKQDRVDMIGLKEVEDFKKQTAKNVHEQSSLL